MLFLEFVTKFASKNHFLSHNIIAFYVSQHTFRCTLSNSCRVSRKNAGSRSNTNRQARLSKKGAVNQVGAFFESLEVGDKLYG
jgi:hypothetical protein